MKTHVDLESPSCSLTLFRIFCSCRASKIDGPIRCAACSQTIASVEPPLATPLTRGQLGITGNVKEEQRQRNNKRSLTTVSDEAVYKESSIEEEVESCKGYTSQTQENEQRPGKKASAKAIISVCGSYRSREEGTTSVGSFAACDFSRKPSPKVHS